MREVKTNKVIYICLTIGILVSAFILKSIDQGVDSVRYEQHLSQPNEVQLAQLVKRPESDMLVTHLPIVSIETGNQKIPGKAIMDYDYAIIGTEKSEHGEDKIIAKLQTMEKEGQWHQASDKPDKESDILLNIRGNSSRGFDKSNYRVELIKEKNPEIKNKLSLLGMRESSSWVLHGPFLDKTLIRNYMWMNISAQVMGYAPNVRFCELLLDGTYQGVYVLMETIEVSEQRLNLSQYTPGDLVMSYVVHIESRAELSKSIDTFSFYTKRLETKRLMEISYPGTSNLTEQVKEYINMDISKIEKAIYSYQAGNDSDFYIEYLDEDSFVDYYILQEFLANNDAYSASTYFYKDARGKFCIGPVWDYNNVLDNNFITSISTEQFFLSDRGFYSQLMKSERFVKKVIRRYRELRKGILSEEYLLNYIQQTRDWLGSAIERNFSVWGYTFDWEKVPVYSRRKPELNSNQTERDVNPSSYDEANEWMIDYMIDRGNFMDQHIESLLQYCQPSKNANTALY